MVLIELGKRIKFFRRKKQWSQEVLSFESEIHKNYICDLENGKRNPSILTLSRLCAALDVTLEELFKGIEIE